MLAVPVPAKYCGMPTAPAMQGITAGFPNGLRGGTAAAAPGSPGGPPAGSSNWRDYIEVGDSLTPYIDWDAGRECK